MANKKVFKSDTKVKVISNSNAKLEWKSNLTGRMIIWQKAGSPAMVSFDDLQDMAWNNDTFIQEGLVYIPDKEVFDALELTNLKWEDVKPIAEVQAMLTNLDIDELLSQIKSMKSGSKETLAQYVFDNRDRLTGAIINTVEEATGIKIKTMIDDYNANQNNIKNNK